MIPRVSPTPHPGAPLDDWTLDSCYHSTWGAGLPRALWTVHVKICWNATWESQHWDEQNSDVPIAVHLLQPGFQASFSPCSFHYHPPSNTKGASCDKLEPPGKWLGLNLSKVPTSLLHPCRDPSGRFLCCLLNLRYRLGGGLSNQMYSKP